MKTLKTRIYSICAMALLLILASCQGRVKLTVLGEDSSNLQAMAALKSEYERENNIKIVFHPNTFEDAWNKSIQDFRHGTGLYDIVLQYNFSLSTFVRNGYVYCIDDLLDMMDPKPNTSFEQDLFQKAWKEVGWYYKDPSNPNSDEIQKIGYPFAINTMLLTYNKKMFEDQDMQRAYKAKYGEDLVVPTTWEQFRNIAEFFTTSNTYGICMQGAEGGWLYYEYCNYLYGMDGSVFDKTRGWEGTLYTPMTITSPEAVAATKFYRSLKPFNKGNYTTVDATEQIRLLQEGNVAMGIVWSDYLYEFDKYGENFGFAPIPGNKSAIAGGSFYVNKNSKNPQEAIKYIMHLMQPKMQIELAKRGLSSPLKSTYNDPEVQKISYSNALKTSLERGVYMFEAGIEAEIVSQVITNHIQRLWRNDNLKVEDVLEQIKQEIDAGRKEAHKNL
ncbi:MAG: extracellular solute-binding protein [Bacteroidales bacterium]|nr:extracellular solute-binding protein [Bacteroidales bacterium]